VTVADRAGNVAGPIEWEFAVASPADLHLTGQTATSIVAGGKVTMRFVARDGSAPMTGARIVIAARAAGGTGFHTLRTMTTNAAGAVAWIAAPLRNTVYRAELEAAPAVRASRTVAVRHGWRSSPTTSASGTAAPCDSAASSLRVTPAAGCTCRC
jgi:hypothetical protein